MIHAYRRIILRDPILPPSFCPDWPGAEARDLCAAIYRRVLPASERWLDRHAVDESGPPCRPARDIAAASRLIGRHVSLRRAHSCEILTPIPVTY